MQLDESLVYKTAKWSTFAQLFLGSISLIGFTERPENILLWYLLGADVVVQLIELMFYVTLLYVGKLSTYFRYYDWFLTTPTQLITTAIFAEYLHNNSLTLKIFFDEYATDTIAIVVFNAIMLIFGYVVERKLMPRVHGVLLGFIPFISTFTVLFVRFSWKSTFGAIIVTFVFIVWSLYGVAALFSHVIKNVSYNLLDVLAKNFYGVLITIFVITE